MTCQLTFYTTSDIFLWYLFFRYCEWHRTPCDPLLNIISLLLMSYAFTSSVMLESLESKLYLLLYGTYWLGNTEWSTSIRHWAVHLCSFELLLSIRYCASHTSILWGPRLDTVSVKSHRKCTAKSFFWNCSVCLFHSHFVVTISSTFCVRLRNAHASCHSLWSFTLHVLYIPNNPVTFILLTAVAKNMCSRQGLSLWFSFHFHLPVL